MFFALVFSAHAIDAAHANLKKVYDANVSGGRVNYSAIKAAPADLDAYLAEVASASVSSMSANDKKAFYINAYNALTIDLIVDNWPLDSIMNLDGGKVWDTRKFTVAGAQMSLNDIENKTLRPLGDPRIHAAVNCASLGCPPISSKVFLGSTLDAQLESVTKTWAAAATFDGTTLTVNKILDWYKDDFIAVSKTDIPGLDGGAEAAANFIAKYAPDKAEALAKGGYTVAYGNYSWSVNKK